LGSISNSSIHQARSHSRFAMIPTLASHKTENHDTGFGVRRADPRYIIPALR
jgi:hypothetical protein